MMVKTSRRSILRAGTAALGAPFLPMIQRRAEAALTPRRLVVFATPNGTVMDTFFPADQSFGEILKPIEPFRSKLLVMRGLNMNSAYKAPVPRDHGPDFSNALTGRQRVLTGSSGYGAIGGISVDQHIANAIGSRTKFASLQLGVGSSATGVWPLLARGYNQPIAPETTPQKAFDRVFGGLVPGAGDPAGDRLRAERQSLLDYVKDDLADLRCQIGTQERYKLEAHLESIREVERSLSFTTAATGTCKAPTAPGTATMDFPTTAKAQMDLVTATLACDLTRVLVLQLSGGGSNTTHGWVGVPSGHHDIAHNVGGVNASESVRRGWLIKIENWFAQQFAYLLGKLAAIPDGAGTLLDSSAVVWIHEQSNGGSHDRKNMPYVIAGGCGGFFRTGRFLAFPGTHHNNLLVSLMNAMEIPGNTFGDPAYCTGPLAELR